MKLPLLTLLLCAFGCLAAVQAEVEIGQPAKDFTLTDTQGKTHSLSDFKGKYVVLEWYNPDCPFVRKHYGSGHMQGLQKKYTDKGVVWLSINSSAPGNQGNYTSTEYNEIAKKNSTAPTALLLDHDGKVGHLYGAKTTPHMFVIDPQGNLIYQGAIDDKPTPDPADLQTARNFVAAALDESMAGQPVAQSSTKPYGCGVKY